MTMHAETLVFEPVAGCTECDYLFTAMGALYTLYATKPEDTDAKERYHRAKDEYHVHCEVHTSPHTRSAAKNFLEEFAELGGAYFTHAFKQTVLSRSAAGDTRYVQVLEAMHTLLTLSTTDQSEEGKAFFAFAHRVNELMLAYQDLKEQQSEEQGK